MSLSQLIEKRRQTHEVQDQQQRQQPMRGNAEYAAGARAEHDLQQWEQRREREYREQNLGKGVVTAAEIDAWHEKQGQSHKQTQQPSAKAERDWDASLARSSSAQVDNRSEMKLEKAASLPNLGADKLLAQAAQSQTQDQEQRRRMSR